MKMFYHEGYKGQNSFLEQLSAKSLKGLFQSFFKKSIQRMENCINSAVINGSTIQQNQLISKLKRLLQSTSQHKNKLTLQSTLVTNSYRYSQLKLEMTQLLEQTTIITIISHQLQSTLITARIIINTYYNQVSLQSTLVSQTPVFIIHFRFSQFSIPIILQRGHKWRLLRRGRDDLGQRV